MNKKGTDKNQKACKCSNVGKNNDAYRSVPSPKTVKAESNKAGRNR